MLKSSLCDYSDAYILFVGGTTIITGAVADNAAKLADEREKKVITKNCALSKINNSQKDNTKDIIVVMPMI